MRPLSLCALGCCAFLPCVARAQSAVAAYRPAPRALVAPARPAPSDTSLRFRIHIPAQPLARALVTFGQQTGLRVEVREGIAAEVQSGEVSGTFTAPEA